MPIMTLIEAIQNRHSVRRYRPDPIDETALARLEDDSSGMDVPPVSL